MNITCKRTAGAKGTPVGVSFCTAVSKSEQECKEIHAFLL